jgi:signal transduction histidine kinase
MAAIKDSLRTSRFAWKLSGVDAGFIAIVAVAYFSALVRLRYGGWPHYSRVEWIILISSSLLYLIIGTAGFAFCRQKKLPGFNVLYLAVQVILAETILRFLPSPVAFLIILPLAGQSFMLLSRIWAGLFCVFLLLTLAIPIGWRFGLFPAFVAGSFVLAGMVFVVAFTLLAINEANSRQQVERLADALSEANQKLRDYASQAEELATLRERGRLAREIHDSLGHYLTVVNVLIEASRAVLHNEPQRAGEILEQAQALTREGLAEVRRAVSEMHDSLVDLRPLPETLESLAEECRITGIDATLEVNGEPAALSPEVRLTLYRAAQEGLTNVRRHAQASCVSLKLDFGDSGKVRLRIEDNGIGGAETKHGFGLDGIRQRAGLLGGEVFVRGEPGLGFSLEVELPR